jgi:hypothetical protein
MATADVDYAQSSMTKADITVNEQSLIVGPAMRNHVTHAFQHMRVNYAMRSARKGYSVYSTHKANLDFGFSLDF